MAKPRYGEWSAILSSTFMLNGITKAEGTFFYFPPLLKTANGAAEPSSAENALVACSNTTAAPHELFDLTGIYGATVTSSNDDEA